MPRLSCALSFARTHATQPAFYLIFRVDLEMCLNLFIQIFIVLRKCVKLDSLDPPVFASPETDEWMMCD